MKFLQFSLHGERHLGLVRGNEVRSLGLHDMGDLLAAGVDLCSFATEAGGTRAGGAQAPPITQP
ncbi:MAG: 5-oxopent-3-ene-1,2,5-tricarboxylate decarboxylase, partial [Janthinobacterium sp.]